MNAREDLPEFGTRRDNEERRDGGCGIIFNPKTGLYAVGERRREDGLYTLFGGGLNEGEDIRDCVIREVREESGLHAFVRIELLSEALAHYHNRSKDVDRVAYAACFLFILKSDDTVATQLEQHEKFSLIWASSEDIVVNWKKHNQDHDFDHWIYFLDKAVARLSILGYTPTH